MASDQGDAAEVRRTSDPTLLRSVVEERGGYPAHRQHSEGEGDGGLLRVGFRDRDEDLKQISWDEFLDEFEEKDLVGVYATDGGDARADRPVELVEAEEAAELVEGNADESAGSADSTDSAD